MHSEVVAVLVDCLTVVIGFTSLQIDWLIAYRAQRGKWQRMCGHWELLCLEFYSNPRLATNQLGFANPGAVTQPVRKPPSGLLTLYRTLGKPEAAVSSLVHSRTRRRPYQSAAFQSRNPCTHKPPGTEHIGRLTALRFLPPRFSDLTGLTHPLHNASDAGEASLYAGAFLLRFSPPTL